MGATLKDWVLESGRNFNETSSFLSALFPRLYLGKAQVHRGALSLDLSHPLLHAEAWFWTVEHGLKSHLFEREVMKTREYLDSPLPLIRLRHTKELRIRLNEGKDWDKFPITRSLRAEGFTDYIVFGLNTGPKTTEPLTLATRAKGGFSEEALHEIRQALPIIELRLELFTERLLVRSMSDVYFGPRIGEEVRLGKMTRGLVKSFTGAIWYCDLRGFTPTSMILKPQQLSEWLNEFYLLLEDAVRGTGGEIFSFVGDGAFVLFPVGSGGMSLACSRAYVAWQAMYASVSRYNRDLVGEDTLKLAFSSGLHCGEVSYCNLGGLQRLSFTAIGPDVNLAARLQQEAARREQSVLASAAFYHECPRPLWPLGAVTLKGFTKAEPVYGWPNSEDRHRLLRSVGREEQRL